MVNSYTQFSPECSSQDCRHSQHRAQEPEQQPLPPSLAASVGHEGVELRFIVLHRLRAFLRGCRGRSLPPQQRLEESIESPARSGIGLECSDMGLRRPCSV